MSKASNRRARRSVRQHFHNPHTHRFRKGEVRVIQAETERPEGRVRFEEADIQYVDAAGRKYQSVEWSTGGEEVRVWRLHPEQRDRLQFAMYIVHEESSLHAARLYAGLENAVGSSETALDIAAQMYALLAVQRIEGWGRRKGFTPDSAERAARIVTRDVHRKLTDFVAEESEKVDFAKRVYRMSQRLVSEGDSVTYRV